MTVLKVKQIKNPLTKAIAYITRMSATDHARLVTFSEGTFTSAEQANEIMMSFIHDRRTGGVTAHHIIQSFDPNDPVDADKAHAIGVRFIEELTGGRYAYIIATHTDKDHVHNHILMCSTSKDTFKKMRVQRNTLDTWRTLSDDVCRHASVSVLDKPSTHHRAELAELYAQLKGVSFKDHIRSVITTHASHASTFDEFQTLMRADGYEVRVRGKHVTYVHRKTGKAIRDSKLGIAYDETAVMTRIMQRHVHAFSFHSSLIADANEMSVSVYLPHTRRQRMITISRSQLVKDGVTYHAYIPKSDTIPIYDTSRRLDTTMSASGLYEYFTQPSTPTSRLISPSGKHDAQIHVGVSVAQRKYYDYTSRRIDAIKRKAETLNTLIQATHSHGSLEAAVADLLVQIDNEKTHLHSTLIALSDATTSGNTDLTVEYETDVANREKRLAQLAHTVEQLNTYHDKKHERTI